MRHLTQCKYHRDTAHACSNHEVSELPLGLIKHGYRCGLFVTNAGLTAPAKREYLDCYPMLELEFLDGLELFSEVLGHLMLRAVWYDGRQLSSLASQVVFPIIVRIHKRDQPLGPLECDSPLLPMLKSVVAGESPPVDGPIITAGAKNLWTPTSFDPYRPPEAPGFIEGGMSMIMVSTLSLSGAVSIEDIAHVPRRIAQRLASIVSSAIGTATVVVGKPALLSNLGETEFIGALLPMDLIRVVGDNGRPVDEVEWFYPYHKRWSTACDARTGQEPSVRMYHPSADVALSYRIRSSLTPTQRMNVQRRRRSWDRCLYALVPADIDLSEAAHGVPSPDNEIPWGEGIPPLPTRAYKLAVWWHSHYVQDGYCVEPRFNLGADEEDLENAVAEEDRRLEDIERRLSASHMCHPVSPRNARLLSEIGVDDGRDDDITEWDTASIVTEDIEAIPAPMLADGRIFECEIAWETGGEESVLSDFESAIPEARVVAERWNGYFIVCVKFYNLDLSVCTSLVLDEVERRMHDAVLSLEESLPHKYKRATRRYWWRRYRVRLGLNYGDQDPSDGSIS